MCYLVITYYYVITSPVIIRQFWFIILSMFCTHELPSKCNPTLINNSKYVLNSTGTYLINQHLFDSRSLNYRDVNPGGRRSRASVYFHSKHHVSIKVSRSTLVEKVRFWSGNLEYLASSSNVFQPILENWKRDLKLSEFF